jgi:excinuclease ABC subunit C
LSINAKKLADLSGGVELSDDFTLVNLPNSSHIIKLLQRIRDESHRFAVSYHSVLKKSRQTKSVLDDIPGIGPKTRSKLIRKFGSVQGIKKASEQDLASVVGVAKSKIIINFIQSV